MSIVLKIPCVEDQLLDVEVDRDLNMTFLNYDIDYDILMESMGDAPAECLKILWQWREHPLSILFGGCGIPISELGIVCCHLTLDALRQISSTSSFKCFKSAEQLTKACLRSWKSKNPSLGKIYQYKHDLRSCWNKKVSEHKELSTQPTFAEERIVEAAEQCSEFVSDFWLAVTYGGYRQVPQDPRIISKTCRQAVASTQYEIPYPSRWHQIFEDQEMYGAGPDKLLKILLEIEADQARLAIRVLEKMERQP